jgi:hypothetical protein
MECKLDTSRGPESPSFIQGKPKLHGNCLHIDKFDNGSLHSCNNPLSNNPAHWFTATNSTAQPTNSIATNLLTRPKAPNPIPNIPYIYPLHIHRQQSGRKAKSNHTHSRCFRIQNHTKKEKKGAEIANLRESAKSIAVGLEKEGYRRGRGRGRCQCWRARAGWRRGCRGCRRRRRWRGARSSSSSRAPSLCSARSR